MQNNTYNRYHDLNDATLPTLEKIIVDVKGAI